MTSADVVPLEEALALGREAWEAAVERPQIFSSWEWYRAWADCVAPVSGQVASAVVLLDGSLANGGVAGIVPIMSERGGFRRAPARRLTFAGGDFGCPDHQGLSLRSDAHVRAFWGALQTAPWDLVEFENLQPDDRSVHWLLSQFGRTHHAVYGEGHVCPFLPLPSSWSEYEQYAWSSKSRSTMRRKRKKLFKAYDVEVEHHEGARVQAGFDVLMALHEERWRDEGGGVFRDREMAAFHRRLGELLDERGQLWLATMRLDGVPRAAWYGFRVGDTVSFYQAGRSAETVRDSPGTVLMAMMIERAIAAGAREFDFLRGTESYKWRWTKTYRTTRRLTLFRNSLRGRLCVGLERTARGVHAWRQAGDDVPGWDRTRHALGATFGAL